MQTGDATYLGAPARMGPQDDFLHPAPEPAPALWGDTFWLSVMDPSAGIMGVNHLHITNQGFARVQSHVWIDGVQQAFGARVPATLDTTLSKWPAEGRMTYEVLEPFERLRVTMDNPRFGFDLEYTARSPAFDYDDCVGGNPLGGLRPVAPAHGGHYEQAMTCRGTFEIRGGPAAGQTRQIDGLSHRDHTWSDRFGGVAPWESPAQHIALHFWLVLQFPERNFNAVGFFDPGALGIDSDFHARGGAELSARGCRPLAGVEPVPAYDGDAQALHHNGPRRYRLEFPDGEVLHIRAARLHATAKLWMRAENDLENVLDDYQDLVDLEIEETGEKGYGVMEYSVFPGSPYWAS